MMTVKASIAIALLAALALFGAVPQAAAQTAPPAPTAQPGGPALPPSHPVHRRIVINPRPLLYRRCVDWYELQHRPSGTVLYPQMRCRWVRG